LEYESEQGHMGTITYLSNSVAEVG